MSIKNTFNSKTKIFLSAILGLLIFIGVSTIQTSATASTEVEQKLTVLKKSLSSAKGEKRSKIIKKIAEIENKVLEQKRSSSQSQR